jgi:hypothetical protein
MTRRPLLPVEVERFSDARWSRIERQIFAELDSDAGRRSALTERRWALAWIPAAAVFGAAIVALLVVRPWARGRASDEPVRLATTDSASRFTVGESALTISPNSLVLVRGDEERGVDVVLDHGTIACEVAPRRGRPPFVVDAGEVRVRVVGTGFTVHYDGGAASVEVAHGVVEVVARGEVSTLRDGDHWPAPVARPTAPSGDGGASPPPAEPSPVAPSPARPGAAPRHPTGAVASPRVPSPAGTVAPTDAAPTTVAPTTVAPTTVAPTTVAPTSVAPTGTAPTVPPAAESTPASTSARQVTAAAVPPSSALFDEAARLERSQPDQAAAIYRRLASSDTPWAPNALFALARLEADRGHRADAVRLLQAYLARYPRGINSEDARDLLRRLQ